MGFGAGYGLGISTGGNMPIQLDPPQNTVANTQSGPQINITWNDPSPIPINLTIELYDVTDSMVVDSTTAGAGQNIQSFSSGLISGHMYRGRLRNNGDGISYLTSQTVATNDVTI